MQKQVILTEEEYKRLRLFIDNNSGVLVNIITVANVQNPPIRPDIVRLDTVLKFAQEGLEMSVKTAKLFE